MSAPDPLCGYCEMPLSLHCKGNQLHTDHKEDSRMVDPKWRKGNTICRTRHCLAPLCDCIDFISEEAAKVAEPVGEAA